MSGVQNVLCPHAGLSETTTPSLWAPCTPSYRGLRTTVHRKPALASSALLPSMSNLMRLPIPASSPQCSFSTLSFQEPASSFISGLTIAFMLIFLPCLEKNALILKTSTTRMFLVIVVAPSGRLFCLPSSLTPHPSPPLPLWLPAQFVWNEAGCE